MQAYVLPPNYIKLKMCYGFWFWYHQSASCVSGSTGGLVSWEMLISEDCLHWVGCARAVREGGSSRQHRQLTRASVYGEPFVGASRSGQGRHCIPLSLPPAAAARVFWLVAKDQDLHYHTQDFFL